MEESTCHEMVIYLLQRFSSMLCFYSPTFEKVVAILDLCCLSFCLSVIRHYVRHNFVSTQYIENKSTEFHQIIYMHSC